MRKLQFDRFAYQVVVDEHPVVVLLDEGEAIKYVEEQFKGAAAMILPIALLKYREIGS